MAKNNSNIFLLIAGLIILVLVVGNNLGFFVITGSERMTRSYPTADLEKGSTLNVVYAVSSASGSWASSVVDTLSCAYTNGSLIPIDLSSSTGWKGAIVKKFVIVSDEGNSKTMSYTLPNVEGAKCTFAGTYQFGNKTIMSFTSQTIKTKACLTIADTNCDGTISRTELGIYITKWLNDEVSRDILGTVIQSWASS
jgi:hypothetical protein